MNLYMTKTKISNVTVSPIQGLKQIPVIVLMAMSPLNGQAAEPNSPIIDAPRVEVVDSMQQDNPKRITGRIIHVDGERYYIDSYNKSGKSDSFDYVKFRYLDASSATSMEGFLGAVAETPNSNGEYMVSYIAKCNGKYLKENVCLVPKEVGEYLLFLTKSVRNNNAIIIAPNDIYIKAYGENSVKNAPTIFAVAKQIREMTQ